LLLGNHDSSHGSTGPPGEFRCLSGPGRSIALGVGPGGVSTDRWVVGQETGRRGTVAVEGLVRRDILSRYVTEDGVTTAANDFRDRRQAGSRCDLVISDKLLPTDLQQLSMWKASRALLSVARGARQ